MMVGENPNWQTKSSKTLRGNPVTFGLYVTDAYKSFKKGISADATVIMHIKNEFYSDPTDQVMDPFGYKWMIATYKEDVWKKRDAEKNEQNEN